MSVAESIFAQQAQCLELRRQGLTLSAIAQEVGLSQDQVWRRIKSAKKAERLDPQILRDLADQGVTDLGGLHSGWSLKKDGQGSGLSLYFMLGPDEEALSLADAIRETLTDLPLAPLVPRPRARAAALGQATWFMLADLHVGGDYGDPYLQKDFERAVDDIVSRLPPAEKAVLVDLGDLLDANDHKGVTPASGNPCDVRRDDHLKHMQLAVALLRHAILRLLATHRDVEVHLLRGNHDPTAYMGVMLALAAHFAANPRVEVVVSDAEYRVIPWGTSALFPHHGDTLNWAQLKDVWADQFADAWATARMHRQIATAHLHHDRKKDLVGCVAEQFRTLHRPNGWAKGKGLFSRGSLTAITVCKELGERGRTTSFVKPLPLQDQTA